jgi:hypothetical protein
MELSFTAIIKDFKNSMNHKCKIKPNKSQYGRDLSGNA